MIAPSTPARLLRLLCALAGTGLAARAADPAATPPLTTADAVLSLSAEQAGQRLPVAIRGVVTAAEPDWSGQFFVQDETGGVFVENLGRPEPQPGDVVTLTGVSHPGAYAPIVSAPAWTKIGTQPLPAAKPVLIDNLESGLEDGLRVEVAGIVRTARVGDNRLSLALAVGGYRLQVYTRVPAAGAPAALIGARVRVRGTAATHYNAALRHLTFVSVYVPRREDFTVLEPEAADPFAQPAVSLNRVAQYHRDAGAARRMHVRGIVTHRRIGEDLFLQDDTGGIRIETDQLEAFTPGEPVDAVGFLEYENYLPLLRDATVRRGGPAGPPVAPRAVSVADLKNGLHHADLITLRGRIVDRTTRPIARAHAGGAHFATTWLLQGDGLMFTADYEGATETPALADIPLGSVVEVDGVCFSAIDGDSKLKALRLLLASPAAMRVIARPSWFTPERLLIGVGMLSAILLVVAGWLVTVAKKNAVLRDTLRELRRAQAELQEAHDTLEQKVAERSAQLQVEMTARKTAELQFKAVLAERTRLARDLHDTLEQTLTGIALQLDTSARLFPRSTESAQHHLQLARGWLRQSQVDLRRSIWDLRSRELEQFDLAHALEQSGRQFLADTTIAFDFATRGDKRPLPEIVEENILRIGQEALTNVAKHAQATRVAVLLAWAAGALTLRIEDDGVGFERPPLPSAGDSHFGLLGMSERVKRLAGRIAIDSTPGRGTTITVEVPLEPAPPVGARADAVLDPTS